MTIRYGILDGDGYWMGNGSGPLVFDDESLARCAQAVLYEQFGHMKHFEVAEFQAPATLTIHDELPAEYELGDAIKLAEGERVSRDRRLSDSASPGGAA